MKTLETKKEKMLVLSVLIILVGIFFGGIGGIVLGVLLISVIGTGYGAYKKEKRIWKPFLISSVLLIIGIALFIVLLLNSSM